ncbi:hypothetical protein J0A67_01855 [Algoriphagus aestuariicola]|uniref:Uncharacterized protein n=1 Tax=Algoriphagus aestuariicola TaxID=1852016 RepID=A0ABS3BK94_9BACT|nr:hypothetical protein [Algoriphagus aestuariicola]MBN7799583.1 hypothetical protein [Algoriphagus aestuariicola]
MPTLSEFSKLKANANLATTALDKRFFEPFISNRNRLEGLPRQAEFEKSLRAETADPMWMLTRQWQLGEFQGEDAGTACQAKILTEEQAPRVLIFGKQGSKAYDAFASPLEPEVESEAVEVNLHLQVQMGRQFLRILAENGQSSLKEVFLGKYPLDTSPKAEDREGLLFAQTVNGRFPDGHAILRDIQSGAYADWVNSDAEFDDSDRLVLTKAVPSLFETWFKKLYHQIESGQNAWIPDRMEYNFSLEMPQAEGGKTVVLEADQYASGKLEWSSFDENLRSSSAGVEQPDQLKVGVQTFIPAPLQYSGIPNPRFWQMEDGQIDFAKIQVGTTGLLSMLLTEYGITYSNDWFVLPYPMKINSYCEVKNILVTDVFGQHILIEPTFTDPEVAWHEFAVFRHTERQNLQSPRNRFYLAPSILKLQQSEPLEKVNFMRDEMTNMVWAIENTVPSNAGGGREVKLNRPRFDPLEAPDNPESKIRYLAGTTVPENWIPFIPVHKSGSEKEIRLQRAKIPNAPAPQSLLLKEHQPVHFIEEEEVPRAGVIVKRTFKRTRWIDGKTILWVGRTKTTGRGEGWSGLMFDRLLPIEKKSE